uniref:Junctional cadherin 5 associated n=1 Tax=Latimeria chalumnae TaxID=7897 RepID=H3ABD6_LATCH
MFSVEDLLISHGYKLPKNSPSSYETRYAGCHREITENRSGHGTVNGYETDTGAYTYSKKAPAKGYYSDNEGSQGSYSRQDSGGCRGDTQNLATFHTAEAGFIGGSPLICSSPPKTDKDVAYWRRRGQDFSVLLSYTDKKEWDANGSQKGSRESCEVVKDYSILEGKRQITANRKWQSLGTEDWKPAVGLGKQMSDGDGDRLVQEFGSHAYSGNALHSQNKGKSRSLPRVLLSESVQHIDLSKPTHDKYHSQKQNLPGCQDFQPYAKDRRELSENYRAGGRLSQLPKPKFSRPLKPPPYELYQKTRESVGMLSGTQDDNRTKDGHVSYFDEDDKTRLDIYIQDTGKSSLEPPVYVPPPSYKLPLQRKFSQDSFSERPSYSVYMQNDVQFVHKKITNQHSSTRNKSSRDGCYVDIYSRRKLAYEGHADSHMTSVQYIPFDDPRIRHLTAQSEHYYRDKTGNMCTMSQTTYQDKVYEQFKHSSALVPPPETKSILDSADMFDSSFTSHLKDYTKVNGAIANPDGGTDSMYKKPCIQNIQVEQGSSETVTKVKKFETEAEVQTQYKSNSKRKMTETVFCLVSVPLKPHSDNNNNDFSSHNVENCIENSPGSLKDQSILSMSSTDLELQALTGSMMNQNRLKNSELHKQIGYKQTDLNFSELAKHKELRYSGSWPGDQYKDQQTQTSFTEDPKSSQHIQGSPQKERPSNRLQNRLFSDSKPIIGANHRELVAKDDKYIPTRCMLKGQTHLSPSSNSAFSRTSSGNHVNKTYQSQFVGPSGSLGEKERNSANKSEVVSSSNSKEAFGQFLLKPVGRRPWDAISELESFNKELQEQEENSVNGQLVGHLDKIHEGSHEKEIKNSRNESSNKETDCESPRVALEVPVFQSNKEIHNSEFGSRLSDSNYLALSHIPSKTADCRNKIVSEVVSSLPKDDVFKGKRESGSRINKRIVTTKVSEEKSSDSFTQKNIYSLTETKEDLNNLKDTSAKFVHPGKVVIPKSEESASDICITWLSLVDGDQGYSEPDSGCQRFDSCSKLNESDLSDLLGKESAADVPQTESLEARAARILGIDVPFESLLPADDNCTDQNQIPTKVCEPLENTETHTNETDLGTSKNYRNKNLYCMRETKVLDGNIWQQKKSKDSGENNFDCVFVKSCMEKKLSEQPVKNMNDQPVIVKNEDKKVVVPSLEKKVRSTSKMIETLQGKLASSPSRTVVDRLVRMKEVDSVSRMRRLSCKTADSEDEAD